VPGPLSWLALGAFAVGTEGFMIAGLLPVLARDLNAGLPAVGHLVSAFSLAYALGAPVMAVLTAALERRRVLAFAMGAFALANVLAAAAPSYAPLLAARLLLAVSAATFMPAATGYAAALGGPDRRGRNMSMVTNGLTFAIIAGAPLGLLVGESLSWRATFLGVAGLSSLSLFGILGWMPRQLAGVRISMGERLAVAKRYDVLGVLLVTVLTVAGTFTVYTYLAVFLAGVAGQSPPGLALTLLGFGLASAVGARLGGSAADHLGARVTVILGGGLVLLAYIALSLGAALGPSRAMLVLVPAILLWGSSSWGLITAQQVRLVSLAPELAPISLSLNSSAIYLGSATGAGAGALVIADGAVARLGWVATVFSVAALLAVLASRRSSPSLGSLKDRTPRRSGSVQTAPPGFSRMFRHHHKKRGTQRVRKDPSGCASAQQSAAASRVLKR
jgi:predicted MFS family arabinose efflux permease